MVKINIIVDGSNVAFFKRNKRKEAKLQNLEILISFLEKLSTKFPINHEIITDASLRYRIDKKSELEKLYNTGKLLQCPSKIQADEFLLEFFRNLAIDALPNFRPKILSSNREISLLEIIKQDLFD